MILIAIFALLLWLLPVIGFIVTSFTAFVAMAAVGEHDTVRLAPGFFAASWRL